MLCDVLSCVVSVVGFVFCDCVIGGVGLVGCACILFMMSLC